MSSIRAQNDSGTSRKDVLQHLPYPEQKVQNLPDQLYGRSCCAAVLLEHRRPNLLALKTVEATCIWIAIGASTFVRCDVHYSRSARVN